MELAECQFVAVDCETTGIHPGRHHRIIELAMVGFDQGSQRDDVWSSLLNPGRDLGPTGIHGIRGRDLRGAPSFGEVLGEVLERLAGRVLVAHNARFDLAFLDAEIDRLGEPVPVIPAVCTMQLAGALGRGGSRARLRDCCAEHGIALEAEHTATGDAVACASLMRSYLPLLEQSERRNLASIGCPDPLPASSWPTSSHRRAPTPRDASVPPEAREPAFLARIAAKAEAPGGSGGGAGLVAPYLDVLDRALEDRKLTDVEQGELAAVAQVLGLGADRVRAIHADYVATLVAIAWRDGVVTERERADLELVAEALGVGGVSEALGAARSHHAKDRGLESMAGLSVCFTGELLCTLGGTALTRHMAQELASAAGMVVKPSVTKALDVLVVADPDSMSGKAKKAREYGTRIIAEPAFWPMIGVEVG